MGKKSREKKERQQRVAEMKEEIHRRGGSIGGPMTGMSLEMQEAFFSQILATDDAQKLPKKTHLEDLQALGISPKPPEQLSDADLIVHLPMVLNGLARLKIYLKYTEHLSDRECYNQLWTEILCAPNECPPGYQTVHELVEPHNLEQALLFARYYADEFDRDMLLDLLADEGIDQLPEREAPPYPRTLPQPPSF